MKFRSCWPLLLLGGTLATAAAEARTIEFSSYTWDVKTSTSAVGPGPNLYSDSTNNVWVDDAGKLHLAITANGDGTWSCAEIYMEAPLGFGTYTMNLDSAVDALDPNVVAGFFTYDYAYGEHHQELDIEFSRWGDATRPQNVQYTVQPSRRWSRDPWILPAGYPTTQHQIIWSADSVSFQSSAGDTVLASWTETHPRAVPSGGEGAIHLDLWLDHGAPPSNGQPVEIVIDSVQFQAPPGS